MEQNQLDLGNFRKPHDWHDEWKDMPEYDQPSSTAKRSIVVHFRSDEDYVAFATLIGQLERMALGRKKAIWYPEKCDVSRIDHHYDDKDPDFVYTPENDEA